MRYLPTVILDGRLPVIHLTRMEVINPVSIEQRCTALDTMHFISFTQEEFSKVSPVLSGDTGTHARLVMFFYFMTL